MTVPIVHDDLFGFLGLELPWSAGELREMALSGPDNLLRIEEAIAQSSLAEVEVTLGRAIRDRYDSAAPLVAENVVLTPRKLRSLLARQAKDPDVVLGPFLINPSDTVLRHYQRKIEARLRNLVDRVREQNEGNVGAIHQFIAARPTLRCIEEYFGQVVDQVLTAPENLQHSLAAITGPGSDTVLSHAVNTALVAMSVWVQYERFPDPEECRRDLTQLATAALLQDISLVLETNLSEDRHAVRSREFAKEMGAAAETAAWIEQHHAIFATGDDAPRLEDTPIPVRILAATNVFLAEVRERRPGQNFETMKNLNFLAENGLIDKRAFGLLLKMYLPKLKSFVIEKANQLASQCPLPGNRPILWPVTGDKVPTIFLCISDECEHRTGQLSQIARDIPFLAEGRTLATIPKGAYFTCPVLTARLRAMYATIQSHVRSRG